MQSPISGRKREKSKKTQPQETVLLRYPEPKYKFQGRKIPKTPSGDPATTPASSQQNSSSDNAVPSVRRNQQENVSHPLTGNAVQRPNNEPQSRNLLTTATVSSQPSSISSSSKVTQVSPVTASQNAISSTETNVRSASTALVAPVTSLESPSLPASRPLQTKYAPRTAKPVSVVDPLLSDSSKEGAKNGPLLAGSCSAEELQRDGGESGGLEELQEQLKKAQAERDAVTRQLDVQLQLNAELKKLLVASMGEELESRVERLARDKAEMTNELGGVSKKMTEDYENLDKLSIQADLWRSKYLASKVMVDELASSKAFMATQFQESQEALQQILNERHELRANLIEAYKCLQQVKEAFDPLNSQRSVAALPSFSALSLAKTTQQLAETIRFRLLPSHISVHTTVAIDNDWHSNMTQAESHANELLSRKVELQSVSFSSLPQSQVERYHPQVRYENLTINCCTHCRGEIHLL